MRRANTIRGVALMVAGYLMLTFNSTSVHALGGRISLWQMTLCRGFGMLTLVGLLSHGDILAALHTTRPGLQFLRGVLTVVSLWLIYYGLTRLPLADATALTYLRPVFLTLIGTTILHETIAARRWIVSGISLGGCLLILTPAFASWHTAYIASITGAALNAASIAATRVLAREDTPLTTMAWLTAATLVFSLPSLAEGWPLEVWPLLPGLAVFGTAAVWCGLLAVQYAEVSLLAPYEYIQLVLAMLIGLLLFGEAPNGTTLAGSAVIIASCGVLLLRERRRSSL